MRRLAVATAAALLALGVLAGPAAAQPFYPPPVAATPTNGAVSPTGGPTQMPTLRPTAPATGGEVRPITQTPGESGQTPPGSPAGTATAPTTTDGGDVAAAQPTQLAATGVDATTLAVLTAVLLAAGAGLLRRRLPRSTH